MSKIGKAVTNIGDAAKTTQSAEKEQVQMGHQQVQMGREQIRMGREQLYASGVLGGLLAVALLLLIVLEVQWIRLMRRKLHHARAA